MTTPVPIPAFTDGQIVRQGDLNSLAVNASALYLHNLGGFRTLPPICTLRITTTGQSISYATETQVYWDVADLNTDAMWSSAASGVMTVNTAGRYFLHAQLATSGSQTLLAVKLLVNGLNVELNAVSTFSSAATRASSSATVYLAAGAIVSTFCRHQNGSPATLLTDLGSCRMAAYLLSD